MGSTDLALSWKDHHGVLFTVFEKLLAKKALVDCTLAAEGKFLKAHRIVLSACSPYFEALLDQEYDKHPIIFLRDVQFEDLKTLLEFVYSGEIKIPEDRLVEFLNVAEALQIKGLGGAGSESPVKNSSSSSKSVPPKESDSPVPRKRSRHHSSSSEENSCDRAEIIPINTEQSRPIQSNETEVPKLSAPSIHSNKSNSVNEEIHVDVSKVKKEVINPPSSHSETQSDHEQEENEEILGLKPEFEQVTFTEDYSDDMMPEDNEDSELNQDQPSSSRQYPGFTTEAVNPGEIAMHAPYAAGSAEPSVPEGSADSMSHNPTPGDRVTDSFVARGRSSHVENLKCPGCHKLFKFEDEFRRHLLSHNGERPFSCAVCDKKFMQSSILIKHLAIHFRERHFICNLCLKRFGHYSVWQAHIRSHSLVTPYQCSYCGQRFIQACSLERHIRIHTRESLFSCRLCPMVFRERNHLIDHVKSLHN